MMNRLPKNTQFRWTATREAAALLLAEDEISETQIADQLGICRKTLYSWRQHPEFSARVGDHVGRLQAAMLRYRVAKKRHRMKTLDDMHGRLLTIVEERAAEYRSLTESRKSDPVSASDLDHFIGRRAIPAGGETGLIVRKVKQVGLLVVEEFAFDESVWSAVLATEKQAAQELGQWTEKHEHSGALTFVDAARQLMAVTEGEDG